MLRSFFAIVKVTVTSPLKSPCPVIFADLSPSSTSILISVSLRFASLFLALIAFKIVSGLVSAISSKTLTLIKLLRSFFAIVKVTVTSPLKSPCPVIFADLSPSSTSILISVSLRFASLFLALIAFKIVSGLVSAISSKTLTLIKLLRSFFAIVKVTVTSPLKSPCPVIFADLSPSSTSILISVSLRFASLFLALIAFKIVSSLVSAISSKTLTLIKLLRSFFAIVKVTVTSPLKSPCPVIFADLSPSSTSILISVSLRFASLFLALIAFKIVSGLVSAISSKTLTLIKLLRSFFAIVKVTVTSPLKSPCPVIFADLSPSSTSILISVSLRFASLFLALIAFKIVSGLVSAISSKALTLIKLLRSFFAIVKVTVTSPVFGSTPVIVADLSSSNTSIVISLVSSFASTFFY
ncbi:hypothetical protein [Williamsoniiplasma luminosum]|uniref:Uncharacterized protein n=1 Tax=Williamsoniiplasma luminosum TaxID=214888 RepID=A0A2S0NJZ9_9MOLU|nr:hypothetical protein [Williamsoniiplasma luminosum]AVP49331.1 MAG: hypothetical protein C5T88_01915 [Williamsoniiplasma luminosum]